MREEPKERLGEEAIRVWKIQGGITSLILLIIALPLAYLGWRYLHLFVGVILLIFVLLLGLLFIVILPTLRFRRFRFQVYEEEIDILRGVWFSKRTLIPMVKVQHVDTSQGPILRRYRLANVTIHTAASQHEIPALALEKAEALRDQIAVLARVREEGEAYGELR